MWKYCDSISKLWFLILLISFIHTFPFFSFFFLLFFLHHTYIPIYLHPLLFLSLLSPWFQNLPLCFSSSSLLTFLFLFSFLFSSLQTHSRPWSFDFSSMFAFLFFIFFLLHLTSLTQPAEIVFVFVFWLCYRLIHLREGQKNREERRKEKELI